MLVKKIPIVFDKKTCCNCYNVTNHLVQFSLTTANKKLKYKGNIASKHLLYVGNKQSYCLL